MDKEKAFKKFKSWYEHCCEDGIEPAEIVAWMGMALITDEDLVAKLQDTGEIPSY